MPAEVEIQDHGGGKSTVKVDGVQVRGVRAVTVAKRHNNLDVVTIELLSERTTVLPPASATLADVEQLDARIDARAATLPE